MKHFQFIAMTIVVAMAAFPFQHAEAADDCTRYGETLKDVAPNNRVAAFECFMQLAKDGDSDSQFWIGRAYQLGYSGPPSNTQAAAWFEKAAASKHSLAAFQLARMLEANELPTKKNLSYMELYYQALQTASPHQYGYAQKTPRGQMLKNWLRNGNDESAAKMASVDARYLDYYQIVNGRKKRTYPVEEAKIKVKLGVAPSMSANEAVNRLVCKSAEESRPQVFAVAAAVEGYGVKIEDALTRHCAPPPDTPWFKGGTPLQVAIERIDHSATTGIIWPRTLMLYLLENRGNIKALDTILRAKLPNGRDTGEEVAHQIDSLEDEIMGHEHAFRVMVRNSDQTLFARLVGHYFTEELWAMGPDVSLVNPLTKDFRECVVGFDRKSIDNLPATREVLMKKTNSIPAQVMLEELNKCYREPDYKRKWEALQPDANLAAELNKLKPSSKDFLKIEALAGVLNSLCAFDGIAGDYPAYCDRDIDMEITRIKYWTDNHRSGYGAIGQPQIRYP